MFGDILSEKAVLALDRMLPSGPSARSARPARGWACTSRNTARRPTSRAEQANRWRDRLSGGDVRYSFGLHGEAAAGEPAEEAVLNSGR